MPKDRYGESLEVNDRIVLTKGGTGRIKMSMHKCIITKVNKTSIWSYDYGSTSDGKELRCSVPESRAIKIEQFKYGPDLVTICQKLIDLEGKDWSEENVNKILLKLSHIINIAQVISKAMDKEAKE